MKTHLHDAHYLDRDNLVRTAKRSLDTGDNKRLYWMCKETRTIQLACQLMLKAFGPKLKNERGDWKEMSVSFAIPHGTYRVLAEFLAQYVRPFLAGGGLAFRTAELPVDDDLGVITLSFVRID